MLLLPAIVALLIAPINSEPPVKKDEPFRTVAIPQREHGYMGFESRVISSQKEFDDFVKDVEAQKFWNERAEFIDALRRAKLDFEKEILVLVRQTESSGSIEVKFTAAEAPDGNVACLISRKVPEIGTGDEAYHAFAIAVKKGVVKQVEVRVDDPKGKPRDTFVIPAK